MGQWLSIPFIVLGVYMIWRGVKHPAAAASIPGQHAASAAAAKRHPAEKQHSAAEPAAQESSAAKSRKNHKKIRK